MNSGFAQVTIVSAVCKSAARQYPRVAVIGPQGRYTRDRIQPSYRQAFHERRPCRSYGTPDGACPAKWLHDCGLPLRVSALRASGGFDERCFAYDEDDDLCLRALQASFDYLPEPRAAVMHRGGASSAPGWRTDFRKHFHFFRSRHLIRGKYPGAKKARNDWLRTAVAAPLATVAYALLLRRKYALKWFAWRWSAWPRPL